MTFESSCRKSLENLVWREREVFSEVPTQRYVRASSGLAVGQQVGGAMSSLKTHRRAMS